LSGEQRESANRQGTIMSTKPAENESSTETTPDAPASPGSMHRPAHSPLDTIDIAATDDALHDAALRNSTLRTPR
jgi:hypothetical protein